MRHKTNQLIIVIDGFLVSATPAPVKDLSQMSRCACPGCKVKDAWMPIGDVIQHGFFEDAYSTVFECQKCRYQVYVTYTVPVYEIIPTEGEKHNDK